ncbi:MAG: hypothetical protein NTZ59_12915, partial [Bacteroidetes bacterium]|nr:hypothetical protein [Bacteroidota bacterium]
MSKKTLFIIYGILLIVVLGFGQEPRLVLPESHIENIKKVTFSSTSDLLLSQSTDKCLIWNIKYGKVIMTIQ